jgi:hypothetical protein
MEPKLYRDFKNAMDIAYKETRHCLGFVWVWLQLMRIGRAAPRCRGVDNWVRVVDSFTGSANTLYKGVG